MGRQLEMGDNQRTQGNDRARGSDKWHLLKQNLSLLCPFPCIFPYLPSPIHFVISNPFCFPCLWCFPKHPLYSLTHLHTALKACHNKFYGVSKCPSVAPHKFYPPVGCNSLYFSCLSGDTVYFLDFISHQEHRAAPQLSQQVV